MIRKVWFFLGAALICVALVPLTQEKFRWLPATLAGTYVVLALFTALDEVARRSRR